MVHSLGVNMKKLLLIGLVVPLLTFGQSEPVTRIKGQKEDKYRISPNIQVPKKQVSKINSTTNLLETGNENRLTGGSFESIDWATQWGSTTSVLSRTTSPVEGLYMLQIAPNSGAYAEASSQFEEMNLPVGTDVTVSAWVNTTDTFKICLWDFPATYRCSGSLIGTGNTTKFFLNLKASGGSQNKVSIISDNPDVPMFADDFRVIENPLADIKGEASLDLSGNVILNNNAVTGKNLTGLVNTVGEVLATDSILQAAGKINSKQTKGISGLDDASKDLNRLYAPHRTLTEKGAGFFNVDHGSNQRLYNGSLESGTNGWTCTAGTIVSTNRLDQNVSLNLYGASGRDMECYQDYPTADQGTVKHEMNAWFRFIGNPLIGKPTKGEICARQNGVNVNCVTFDASKDQWNLQQTFADAGTSTTGIYFKMYGDGTNTYNVLVDKTLAGVYTATNSYMDVKQETQPESCGLIASDFVGLGAVSGINLNCKRDGSKLLITGVFTPASPIATQARMNLKYKGSTLTISPLAYSTTAPYSNMGLYFRNMAVVNVGGLILGLAGNTYLNFSDPHTFGTSVVNALVPANGDAIATAGFLLNINASIEIAEWQQNLNVAVSKCLEGPVKCANEYSASLYTVLGSVENENVDWITSCTAANPTVCTLREPTVNPLTCTFGGDISEGVVARLVNRTATTLTIGTYLGTTAAPIPTPFDISCTKTGSDYDTNYDNISVAPLMDIRSTEFLTGGFDYIDGKPIYKRCFKTTSNISTTAFDIITWAANLNILDGYGTSSAPVGIYYKVKVATGSNAIGFSYEKSTGKIKSYISGSYIIPQGSSDCFIYTKP